MAKWKLWSVLHLFASKSTSVTLQILVLSFFSITANYTANSTYQRNLEALFRYLSSNAPQNDFATASSGQSPDRVYGLVLCRPDLTAADCAVCISKDTPKIVQYRPNGKSSIIWSRRCQLKYSDENLIGTLDASYMFYIWKVINSWVGLACQKPG